MSMGYRLDIIRSICRVQKHVCIHVYAHINETYDMNELYVHVYGIWIGHNTKNMMCTETCVSVCMHI